MNGKQVNDILAGYQPALLEDWYRRNYFDNEIDISGSGVEEYTFQQIREIACFNFTELDPFEVKDNETVGGIRIREKIADIFGTGDPEMVMITNGSNEALQLVVRSILKPGDEIITQGPCYHCHDKIAASIGCEARQWQLSAVNNFELDLSELSGLITEKTKAIILNFPHNPTGVSITQTMLDDIVSMAKDSGVFLVWDAAFQQLTYENEPLRDPIHSYGKAITVGTFSKAYGAPGLRFGWMISRAGVIASCVRQKDYGNLYVAPVIECIAEKMLAKIDDFSALKLKQARVNRDIVNAWIQIEEREVDWRRPDGGACGLLKLPKNLDDIAFCIGLLEKYGVLLVPGTCFDMPGFVRLGFGGNTDKLQEGLYRLDEFIKYYRTLGG